MQLSPRYDDWPVLHVDAPVSTIAPAALRQRRRLARTMAGLADAQWQQQSRCDGWSAQDVITHLVSVDQFWNASIQHGLGGAPTRYLAAFDPVQTPAAVVAASGPVAPGATLDAYLTANEQLCSTIEGIADDQWHLPAEAPPGHLAIADVVHHALWDCWVHERDILIPLGIDPPVEDDEVLASLRYAATLGPAFAPPSPREDGAPTVVVIDTTEPSARISLAITDRVVVTDAAPATPSVVVSADSVELLEALSVRAPWPEGMPADAIELLGGLRTVFDQTK